MDGWLLQLTRVGVVGTGLMGGLFFIFSVCIMPALDRLPPNEGTAAMQKVNSTIQNPLFLLLFMGTGLAGAALAMSSVWTWDEPNAGLRLAGGLLYFFGVFVLTMAYHVPRNNALDAATAGTAEGDALWARFLTEWVPWNHVRAVTSIAAAITLTLALTY